MAASHGSIDHEPAVYLIDAQGQERILYLTQMAYETVGLWVPELGHRGFGAGNLISGQL